VAIRFAPSLPREGLAARNARCLPGVPARPSADPLRERRRVIRAMESLPRRRHWAQSLGALRQWAPRRVLMRVAPRQVFRIRSATESPGAVPRTLDRAPDLPSPFAPEPVFVPKRKVRRSGATRARRALHGLGPTRERGGPPLAPDRIRSLGGRVVATPTLAFGALRAGVAGAGASGSATSAGPCHADVLNRLIQSNQVVAPTTGVPWHDQPAGGLMALLRGKRARPRP
jgi:hypothetical protein